MTTINKIINEPTCTKNRALALKSIINIINQSDKIAGIEYKELKNLYSFFTPPQNAVKDTWAWQFQFVSKDETKKHFWNMYVLGEYMYTTDGFIATRSRNSNGLDDGVYDKNKLFVRDLQKNEVIYQLKNMLDTDKMIADNLFQLPQKVMKEVRWKEYEIYPTHGDLGLNAKYIDKLLRLKALKKDFYCTQSGLDAGGPVLIGCPDILALVMPMRIKK
tara:strand:- start:755 stop:1408 length:654 start_codon:yes stop_codon:yes gene_type:complete